MDDYERKNQRSYEYVIEEYGEPHIRISNNNERIRLYYFTIALPAAGSGSSLIFHFKENKVESINIDLPN